MGEGGKGFEGGRFEEPEGDIERDNADVESREANEKREMALEVMRLTSELIEKGAEWDPVHRQNVRAHIQAGLAALGVSSIGDERFSDILYLSLDLKPRVPKDYPTFEEFKATFEEVLDTNDKSSEQVNWESAPSLQQLIGHCYIENWRHVKSRDFLKEAEEYLYQLGKLLCDSRTYQATFPADDNISVRPNGWLQNGRHRILTLRCLEKSLISRQRMDSYIKVDLEKEE